MIKRTFTAPLHNYELIDTGNNQRIECWDNVVITRHKIKAYFEVVLSNKEWLAKAHFEFIESSSSAGVMVKPF